MTTQTVDKPSDSCSGAAGSEAMRSKVFLTPFAVPGATNGASPSEKLACGDLFRRSETSFAFLGCQT